MGSMRLSPAEFGRITGEPIGHKNGFARMLFVICRKFRHYDIRINKYTRTKGFGCSKKLVMYIKRMPIPHTHIPLK